MLEQAAQAVVVTVAAVIAQELMLYQALQIQAQAVVAQVSVHQVLAVQVLLLPDTQDSHKKPMAEL